MWGLLNVDELVVNEGGCVVASVKIENGSKGKPGQVIEVVVCWSQRMLLVVRDLFLWFGDLRFELTKRTDFDCLRGKGMSRQRERD